MPSTMWPRPGKQNPGETIPDPRRVPRAPASAAARIRKLIDVSSRKSMLSARARLSRSPAPPRIPPRIAKVERGHQPHRFPQASPHVARLISSALGNPCASSQQYVTIFTGRLGREPSKRLTALARCDPSSWPYEATILATGLALVMIVGRHFGAPGSRAGVIDQGFSAATRPISGAISWR